MPLSPTLTPEELHDIERYANDFDILELRIDGIPNCEIAVVEKMVQQIVALPVTFELLVTYRTSQQGVRAYYQQMGIYSYCVG